MQRYLTNADMREDKYACIKENANAQRQVLAKTAIRAVWGTIKGNCKRRKILITIDENS